MKMAASLLALGLLIAVVVPYHGEDVFAGAGFEAGPIHFEFDPLLGCKVFGGVLAMAAIVRFALVQRSK